MIPQEICQKLRPVKGDMIDKLWQAYLMEDLSGKREIEQILELLYHQTFASNFGEIKQSILYPPPREKVRGEYPIGQVTYAENKLYPFGLREDDWIKHVLIVGASGSGKTNLCFQILKNFIYKNKPFLVFDWKRNYRDIVNEDYGQEVKVFTVGRNIAPFQFNPLIPPPGTSPKIWLKKLIEIIAHATFVGEGVMYLLQKGLDATYQEFGMYGKDPIQTYPTLEDLLNIIKTMEAKGRDAGWMASTLRALGALTFGESGKVFNTQEQPDFTTILNEFVILEMDALTNNDKIFLIESLLLWIHHYRLSSPKGVREIFEHAILLEEAHHVIGKEKSDLIGGEAITDIIIREIRELGESVIIVDQCPSLLSLPARANTWSTIVLNLKDAKDVNSAASALLLDAADKKILGRLEVGEAVTKLQGRWHKSFTIVIPHVKIKKGSVNDENISKRMEPYSTKKTSVPPESSNIKDIPDIPEPRKIEAGITQQELELMEDIKTHPFSGVVERYKRLNWSRRKGNENKIALIEKNLIEIQEIPTRSGRVVILKLSKTGEELISKTIPDHDEQLRQGGIIHEYWKNRYAEKYESDGYKITIEEPIGQGKSVDVVVRKDDHSIAIEIETGRSNILENIKKCLKHDFNEIIIVATSQQIEIKILRLLKETGLIRNRKIKIECAPKSM
ncbi:MAG: ATP-binding protein [Candidatus Marinimicrobia bacterium]|nr:ATP-binding protein [Candidatus Neomarinimicrobiota bacterium]